MKKLFIKFFFLLALIGIQGAAFAQETLRQTGSEVKSWLAQNWPWLAGAGVVLLVIIAISGGRRSRRKTTTIVKDDYGNVKSVTSTEVIDN